MRSLIAFMLFAVALLGCSSGPVRRVSEPAASIQQLTVRPDGQWVLELRLNNYSSMAMRFQQLTLTLAFDHGAAATLDAQPALDIGGESADVHTFTLTPLPAGRARIANALADSHSLNYTLEGHIEAGPVDGKSKRWPIRYKSALSPVPGRPGALR